MADDREARLRALDERIARAKKAQETPPRSDEAGYSGGELAWRMVIELVTGLLIGFGIGYGLDVVLGTMPIFLVLFVLLGFAAGVRVMLRTARGIAEGQGPDDEGT